MRGVHTVAVVCLNHRGAQEVSSLLLRAAGNKFRLGIGAISQRMSPSPSHTCPWGK